ncbi:Asp-tRNA(Asn)/Glu-tRNA(Gln) amidotransferase subunit GatB [Stratiformator vulcanicus]|uniref:Aspartyl/glutamyl-tRNA(Asn/Gln) amidotransferase subunit B n=1 Tax=Stratiformator vulcanicus TaxID=2527980 RepID=A0A517R2U9_9PLAN|nr:Asp-tRNA(Asn)/Glu-tRNA(Gln) amidotransferase subunit GatB [Stratiformator vulcanicus]QDT38181.1 Aspartyl/glutamyl-tRNA(Asn/Gln) amidotransferase subunit B [Stratiformator vulcanicus]
MNYTTVIGLEVHVQLQTKTKLFSGCINRFNPDQPNTQTDPVTLGLPGTLPVMNRKAYELAVKVGLALNCNIAKFTKWDRKQYYYPDLPKAYQISQYDLPLCADGYLEITDAETGAHRKIGIIRAHLEEDAGKNLHEGGGDSKVDLNRAGTPLVEIVSQPDLRSAAEAKAYLEELKLLMTYLGVSDCNMQEGSLRCDVNVNLHVHTDDGHKVATPIVEVKNMNSFAGVEKACEYEAERQFEEFQETGKKLGEVPKATRGFDLDRGVTYKMREKEEAADYRYFPDPDLAPVTASDEFVESIRATLGEFPAAKRARYVEALELSDYDARVIIGQGVEFARYFETVEETCGDAKRAANWCTQDVQRDLNDRKLTIDEFPIPAEVLGDILKLIVDGKLTTKSARDLYGDLLELPREKVTKAKADEIIAEKGLEVVEDTGALDAAIDNVLAEPKNAKTISDVEGGKQQAVGPLIGQVMKQVKGADPKTVREMLLKKILS